MISERKKQMFQFFLRDKNKKKWPQIIKEFISLSISQKELPLNYISHLLYRRDIVNYKDYLSLKENRKLLQWSYSHAEEQIVLVENKLLFEEILVENGIPTPSIFFHNMKSKFIYKEDNFQVTTKNDFLSFLTNVFDEENIGRLFCKPVDGIRGEHIFIINKSDYQKLGDGLIDLVLTKDFIFQEVIEQHEDLKRINASSVNTLRIITYKNEQNEVEILSGFIRLGRKGAIIDNAHIGGIVVPLNRETGAMDAQGIQLIDNGGGIFHKHPDTGLVFENLQVPLYAQIKEIAAKAASLFKFPLLGWDIAVTPDGPVIIEANHDFHLLLSDRTEKGLKRNPVVENLIRQVQ